MQMRQDYVLVEDMLSDDRTESGLVVPDSMRQKNRAKIIAVGPKVEGLEAGNVVVINKGGMELEVDGKKVRIVKDEHVMLVI